MKARAGIWLVAVALLTAGIVLLMGSGRLQVHSDLLALLPEPEREPVKAAAMDRIGAMGQRRLTLLVKAPGDGDPVPGARAAAAALAASEPFTEAVASVSEWRGAGDAPAAGETVFQHRFHLLSRDDRRALERLAAGGEDADEALRRFTQRARQGLYGLSLGGGRFVEDPFGLSQAYLLDLAAAMQVPGLRVGPGGGLLAGSGDGPPYAAVFAESRRDPYTLEAQNSQLAALEQAMERAREAVPGAQILVSGTLRHAAAATRQARGEVSMIGTGSLLGILVLMTWAFSGLRPFLLSGLALAGGCALAVFATGLIFGNLHVLTIVFGASLVGVAIDYCFHYFAQRWRSSGRRDALRRILPAISLGLATSVIAYGGMGLAPFPGLRQMAVFAVFGLVGAWLGVVLLLPAAAGDVPRREAPLGFAARWLRRGPPALSARRGGGLLALAALAAAGLGALAVQTLEPADDIRLLHSSPPALLADERRVADALGQNAPGRVIVTTGDTAQAALATGDRAARAVRQADPPPATVAAITDSYRTRDEQRRNYELLASTLYREGGPAAELLAEVGYPAARVDEHLAAFRDAEGRTLALVDWLASRYGAAFRPLWLGRVEQRWAAMVQIHEIRDRDALAALLDGVPDALLLDRVAEMSDVLGHYRELMTWLLAGAYALAALVLSLLLGVRSAVAVTLSPLIASLAVALVFAATGWAFSLFNLMALLLLLGMGADYGIFLRLAGREPEPAMAAVGLSALTTLLSFGLLSLSRTPALHSFGLTLALGLTLTFLLASFLATTGSARRAEAQA